MVQRFHGEAFHSPVVRAVERVGPQPGCEQEFSGKRQPAERTPDQFPFRGVTERPEGQHHEGIGRNPQFPPGLAAVDGGVQSFVDVVRDHGVQLLRGGVGRKELPAAVIAQMHHGVGVLLGQPVGFGQLRVALVGTGVVAGVDDGDALFVQRPELLSERRDLFRRRIAPSEQLLGPLEVDDVVGFRIVPELPGRAHDFEPAGADALCEQAHERVVAQSRGFIDDQYFHGLLQTRTHSFLSES